jgi:phosphoribosylformimino-5-aminoimidazole carboxamide ribotide isomerase
MQVIPVLDLKGGQVVRGVAGRRDEYRPIESRLHPGSDAGGIARALVRTFGFTGCYLADLDAIAGGEPSWSLYDEVVAAGMHVWIDAGTGRTRSAERIAQYLADHGLVGGRVVVGLESLTDEAALRSIVNTIGPATIVFSLDLKQGRPLTTIPEWKAQTPAEIAATAVAVGINSMIVLDLSGVGVGQGVPTLDLCRRLRSDYPSLELITGGGVRNLDDVEAIRKSGCNGALVASALHDGRITKVW